MLAPHGSNVDTESCKYGRGGSYRLLLCTTDWQLKRGGIHSVTSASRNATCRGFPYLIYRQHRVIVVCDAVLQISLHADLALVEALSKEKNTKQEQQTTVCGRDATQYEDPSSFHSLPSKATRKKNTWNMARGGVAQKKTLPPP